MLKQYIINGKQYQYKEGEQPEGAVELKKAVEPSNKAKKPVNTRETEIIAEAAVRVVAKLLHVWLQVPLLSSF